MPGRPWLQMLLVLGLAAGAPRAIAATRPLDIREGSLAGALSSLARQARVELLFDQSLVRGMRAGPIRGELSPEAALSRLLSGTGVGYRTTPDGALVLFAIPSPQPASPARSNDGAIAELLVVGRRTQNIDIRRTENDIQPYRLLGAREIEASARSSLDDFMRVRESANTRAGPPTLSGETRSSIDLRGFGERSTLVLVDGRRMPFAPSIGGEFDQADINGIPLGAVERIEVLTTTAGGIYGPGAVGGVVNVVLRRDYRGADLAAYAGIADRGDAEEMRLEGRLGFTPDQGKTDVMLFFAESRQTPLREGQRGYLERAGRAGFANDPEGYAANLPVRNGVSVASREGELTLDPDFGGAALGARYTYLPLGFSGTRADAAALLAVNAGHLPLELTDDAMGGQGDIATAPRVTSGLFSVRHRVGPRLELFVDGLYSKSRGHSVTALPPAPYSLAAGNLGNPFGQAIDLTFPQGFRRSDGWYSYESGRATAGVIADLSHGWKGSVDYTIAQATVETTTKSIGAGLTGAISGRPAPGAPIIEPFGNWAAVLAALPAYAEADTSSGRLRARSRDLSFHAAGPVLKLPGGPLTVTMLAEDREDRVADAVVELFGVEAQVPAREQRVRSGYAELRAPLGDRDASNPFLRGLEVQLAVRHDRSTQSGPTAFFSLTPTDRFSVSSQATTFTAGARVSPIRALMLRGSVATGERPPTLNDLQTITVESLGPRPADPRRAGQPVGSEIPWFVSTGGSLRVEPAQASSVTLGFVVNPDGRDGPRLSVDYSRIVVSHEAVPFPLTREELLAAEAEHPERIVRQPVTAADTAAGFTVGPVTLIDTSATNIGRTVVEAVDAKLDWRLPTERFDVRLYGALTWQPTFSRRLTPDGATVERVNSPDGPLKWRGNAGVEWVVGATSVDLNAQYYGRHRVTYADWEPGDDDSQARLQGGRHVPAQVYVDLSAARRFALPSGSAVDALEARLSIQNLLDRSPPIVAPSVFGFSDYGDPRRRRVVVSLRAQF